MIDKSSNEAVIKVRFESELSSLIQSNSLVFCYFCAPWCAPCKQIEPYFSKLARRYSAHRFLKCDIEENPEIANIWGVRGLPAFLIFRDRKLILTLKCPLPSDLQSTVDEECSEYQEYVSSTNNDTHLLKEKGIAF